MIDTVLLALASYRLWRLLARDDITEPLRARTIDKVNSLWAQGLWFCSWCLGTWIVIAAGLATHHFGLTTTTPWLMIPAAATLVGLTARVDT